MIYSHLPLKISKRSLFSAPFYLARAIIPRRCRWKQLKKKTTSLLCSKFRQHLNMLSMLLWVVSHHRKETESRKRLRWELKVRGRGGGWSHWRHEMEKYCWESRLKYEEYELDFFIDMREGRKKEILFLLKKAPSCGEINSLRSTE